MFTSRTAAAVTDPVAFVAEAQRMTNERDVAAIARVFARNGRWTTVIDGITTHDTGTEAIAKRWDLLCRFMDGRSMYVEKGLLAATDDTIVNSWRGRARGGRTPMGIEVWQFTPDGLVTQQLLTGFLDPRPDTSPHALLGLLISQPATAIAFARHRLTTRSHS